MIIFKRLLPYLSCAILIAFLELSLKYYEQWLTWLFLILGVVFLTILILNNFRLNKDFFGFLISPFCFFLGVLALLFFQEKVLWQQAVIIISCFVYWLFTNNVSLFLCKSKSYLPFSLENVSGYLNLLALFFIYVSSFSFYILSVSRLRWLLIIIFLSTWFLTWQTMWINKIAASRFKFFSFFLATITIEIYWALHYWPTSFFVNGLILAIIYYLAITFLRLSHSENLNKKNTVKYLILSSAVIIIVLATAQWT